MACGEQRGDEGRDIEAEDWERCKWRKGGGRGKEEWERRERGMKGRQEREGRTRRVGRGVR